MPATRPLSRARNQSSRHITRTLSPHHQDTTYPYCQCGYLPNILWCAGQVANTPTASVVIRKRGTILACKFGALPQRHTAVKQFRIPLLPVWLLGSVASSKKCAKLIDITATRYNARLNFVAMMVLSRARSCAYDANRWVGASYARARVRGGVARDSDQFGWDCAPKKVFDTNWKARDNSLVIIYFNHHEGEATWQHKMKSCKKF